MIKRQGLLKNGLLVWCVLFASFFGNLFNVGYGDDWFTNFQKDSAYIPEKTAACKDVLAYRQPLVPLAGNDYMTTMGSGNCDPNTVRPYASQYGLQARVIAFFAPAEDEGLDSYLKVVEIILASLTSLVLVVFILRIGDIYGRGVMTALTVFIALSPWIAAYARNLYWVTFLMILPFVVSFVLYPYLRTIQKKVLFYILIGFLLFLKSLDGYEHITTLGFSVFAAVAYWEVLRNRKKIVELWPQLLLVGAVTSISLTLAIIVNIVDLHGYYRSWGEAQRAVLSRAEDRATGIRKMQPHVIRGFETTSPEIYKFIDRYYDLDKLKSGEAHSLKYAMLSALNYAMLPAITLPFMLTQPIQAILQSIFVVGALAYVSVKKIGKVSKGLIELYWIGLAGSLSWLVLMPAHAYPHTHLNGIIFYIPFLLVCYIIIGVWLQCQIARVRKTLYEKNK